MIKWRPYSEVVVEEGGEAPPTELKVADGILEIKTNKSNAPIAVTGPYIGDDSKTYTFKVEKRGNVGYHQSITTHLGGYFRENWENRGGPGVCSANSHLF